MNTILDTKPYMLYETVGMLVKYVNRISMLEIRDAMLRLYRNYVDETWHRRLECLQDIVQEVCKDVNREATEMQYFFGRREPGPGRDATTMARVCLWLPEKSRRACFARSTAWASPATLPWKL